MKIHFIAIGGSAMHNLAIALHKKGYQVSGSDDEIFEPSKSRLASYNLLPKTIGWNPAIITKDLDAVILGMHARIDNPELLKAQSLGLNIFSYPEFLYEQSKNKTRIVIGGSHGKTTITAMIIHVLNACNIDCDYMVGAQLEGFDVMVKITEKAKYMILEGDEYLTSPIDKRPKFHLYKPNIALLSGIAWDHINVFPTFENYIEQFKIFINLIEKDGALIYCKEDPALKKLVSDNASISKPLPYSLPNHKIENGITSIIYNNKRFPLKVFGNHNLLNLEGARNVCNQLGITDEDFYSAIASFKGASKRLELIKQTPYTSIYKDFAHSPSKLKATTQAVKQQFPERPLVACLELHTFSSLNKDFLQEYKWAMNDADVAMIYFNPHTLQHKKLPEITSQQIIEAFDHQKLLVFTETDSLIEELLLINWKNKNLLLMSSGNFNGLNLQELADKITEA